MSIQLDHFIVPCSNRIASARKLGELLGVPWQEASFGHFSPVYINDGLTLDFQKTDEPYPVAHYCFRVGQAEFDAILARLQAAGIDYRSNVSGPVDRKSNKDYGGDMLYWNEPDGNQWEMQTVSYARHPS